MKRRPVILDTDIGTDVDDALALAFVLAARELELLGVTTVNGNVLQRARIALKLLALRGAPQIPVSVGAEKSLLGLIDPHWEGYEGQGLLVKGDELLWPAPEHAVDLIIRSAMRQPGEVTLLALGPLTNIALALLREPSLSQALAGITLMGGVIGGIGALQLPWLEHNLKQDPEAAHIVFGAGIPLSILSLDVTTQVRIRPNEVARIWAVGDAFHNAIGGQIERYPRYVSQGWTYLHDPLAVATLIEPEIFEWQAVRARVETGGQYSAGRLVVTLPETGEQPNAQIAVRVDARLAEAIICDHLTR